MTAPTFPPALAVALHAAQAAALPVGKNKKHDHHGYMFVSADVMIGEGRAALREAGLVLFTAGWRFDGAGGDPPAADASGKPMARQIGRVIVTYVLIHTSGATYQWDASSFVIVEKGRPADKGELGAITENLAYTIRGLLLLPRVDEATAIELRDDRAFDPAAPTTPATAITTSPKTTPANAPTTPAVETPLAIAGVDPAFTALAAEFRRRLKDVGDGTELGPLVGDVEAAKLPREMLDELHGEIACKGLALSSDQEDVDFWLVKLQGWKIADTSPVRARVTAALEAAEERIERLAIQNPEAA